MFCPKCGAEISGGGGFCPSCGEPVPGKEGGASNAAAPTKPESPTQVDGFNSTPASTGRKAPLGQSQSPYITYTIIAALVILGIIFFFAGQGIIDKYETYALWSSSYDDEMAAGGFLKAVGAIMVIIGVLRTVWYFMKKR